MVITATSGRNATVSKLFVGSTEVAKSSGSNWAVTNNVITLKKAYLTTLTTGDVTFTVKFSADNDADFTVTVIDAEPGEGE